MTERERERLLITLAADVAERRRGRGLKRRRDGGRGRDPAGAPRTVVASPVAVAQRADDDTLLVSVLDDDAARARSQLDDLCAQARG